MSIFSRPTATARKQTPPFMQQVPLTIPAGDHTDYRSCHARSNDMWGRDVQFLHLDQQVGLHSLRFQQAHTH
ncbi:hypothetical protein BGW80DRAFT_1307712, partial [Lactifluus volemus]